jgi:two-component system, NarL family, nitrate/nitrite sensor histidine kinase NarX
MEHIKQRYSYSVMNYITISLASIFGIGLLSIFISFWVTELADKDAQAINLSGSMRMQTYHIGLALQRGEGEEALSYINELSDTWNHALFIKQRTIDTSEPLNEYFYRAYNHWQKTLKPLLTALTEYAGETPLPIDIIDKQVELTDDLVDQFQKEAEDRIRHLRLFQALVLFITVSVGSLIFYLLKNRIEKPLSQLTQAAHRIGKGDFGHQVDVEGRDELALLGAVINQMSTSISHMYDELDDRVKKRTQELRRNNINLEFLLNTARRILDSHNKPLDFQQLLDNLSGAMHGKTTLELCLFTAQGDKPYLQLAPHDGEKTDCTLRSCEGCHGNAPFSPIESVSLNEKFPIVRDETHYGVINVRSPNMAPLPEWQEQLLRSAADQFALALSLSAQKDQEHRLAMLNERTVIARELHDSLAQALSYLQIQVTRLQKSNDKKRYDLQQPIIDELREGLSSAYRQLRELLTTFRLKIDTAGLQGALENTVKQLRERTEMNVNLHYQLANLPLNPTEEIHLLQIIREASQNSINHSGGENLNISLNQLADKSINLIIDDDGIGIPDTPEKLNHYGLAIMNERSRHLHGKVDISPRESGGTRVECTFMPNFIEQTSATT